MLVLVTESAFSLDMNSPEFKGILKYFHSNRTILYFSQVESLKDLVILFPNWLAKLFNYVIAAQYYKTGSEFDWAWKRLTKYGILHEYLLQHMLDKFHSDYPVVEFLQVTKQQVVDFYCVSTCWHAFPGKSGLLKKAFHHFLRMVIHSLFLLLFVQVMIEILLKLNRKEPFTLCSTVALFLQVF